MSSILRIGRRGRVQFAFGTEGDPGSEPFFVDVVRVLDAWIDVDWQLRDMEGKLPADKNEEYGRRKLAFVQDVVAEAYAAEKANEGKLPPSLTRAEANEFIAYITQEAMKLRSFFPKQAESEPSSQKHTALTFSA